MIIGFFITSIAGIILMLVAVHIRKGWQKNSRCVMHITGTVTGGGLINYGGHVVPRCEYTVNGQTFHVDGPLFKSGTVAPGLACNCVDRQNLPDYFKGPSIARVNSGMCSNDELYGMSALRTLYPVGSPVDIYYNPENPAEAYVQRPVKSNSTVVAVLGLMGIFYLAVAVVMLISMIVMEA